MISVRIGDMFESPAQTLVNTVNCVGACALAPVVVVDEEYQANMTARKMEKQLKVLDNELTADTKEHGHG